MHVIIDIVGIILSWNAVIYCQKNRIKVGGGGRLFIFWLAYLKTVTINIHMSSDFSGSVKHKATTLKSPHFQKENPDKYEL